MAGMTFLYWLAGSLGYAYGGLATARSVYREAAAKSSNGYVRSDDSFVAAICGVFWPLAWTGQGTANYITWFMKRPTRKRRLELKATRKATETRKLMAEAQKIADELGLLIPELPPPSPAYTEAARVLMKAELLAKAEATRVSVVKAELARQVAEQRSEMLRKMGFRPGSYPYNYYLTRADEARRGSFYDEEEDI